MNPIMLLVLFSTGVAVAILVGGAFLYGTNGPFMRAIGLCFWAIALEILVAIVADFYIANELRFVIIKMFGRSIEMIGVAYFFHRLIRIKKSGDVSDIPNSGEQPTEFWRQQARSWLKGKNYFAKPQYLGVELPEESAGPGTVIWGDEEAALLYRKHSPDLVTMTRQDFETLQRAIEGTCRSAHRVSAR